MKIALVQEWLTVIGGSEYVFKEIASLYPEADIFTLVAREETIKKLGLDGHKITTSFIQKLPFAKTRYRSYLPLFPLAIEQFDLSEYDLIISSSHAVAKGVMTHAGQTHVCYCHSPIRYAWDLYHQYMAEAGLNKGIKSYVAKYILHKIRIWDMISTNRVDHFISNSNYVGRRIKKVYGREAVTIHPNVSVDDFAPAAQREDFYLACSRFVPYKKMDLIVKAFNQMPEKKLYVIGDGPDYKKVKKIAKDNIVMLGYQPFDVLKDHMAKAKALIFAAEEDFGMVPVEAQACGTPVIAYGKGGVTESVIEHLTGVFFYKQSPEAIIDAVKQFENIAGDFKEQDIVANASKFSTKIFRENISRFISSLELIPAE